MLEKLIARWCEVPDPMLAEAIAIVGKAAARGVHAPIGVDEKDREKQWMAAAKAGDPVMRQRLVETVFEVSGQDAKLARAKALSKYRDPRVAAMLIELACGGHCARAYYANEFWKPLFEMLVDCGDPRAREVTEREWVKRAGMNRSQQAAFDKRVAKWREKLHAAYPDAPQLPKKERIELAKIVEEASAPAPTDAADADTEAALLAAIYASPADDGPRAIYADWLQERGNPRGEFIALQLKEPEDRRAHELLDRYQKEWAAPLGEIKNVDFARGFPSEVYVLENTRATSHAWATVSYAHAAIPATDEFPMPILSKAYVSYPSALVHLASLKTPPPIEELLVAHIDQPKAIEAFGRVVAKLPLRRLAIASNVWDIPPDKIGWRWKDTTIRDLSVRGNWSYLAAWFEQIRASKLESFELKWVYSFVRDAAGNFGDLHMDHGFERRRFDERIEAVATLLEAMPPGYVTRLKMHVAKDQWKLPHRRRICAAIDRHPKIDAKSDLKTLVRPK